MFKTNYKYKTKCKSQHNKYKYLKNSHSYILLYEYVYGITDLISWVLCSICVLQGPNAFAARQGEFHGFLVQGTCNRCQL